MRGFTLIELVLVMVVVSVGLLGLSSIFSENTKALVLNENVQRVSQYAQECAEHILAVNRRTPTGFNSITTTMCDGAPLDNHPGITTTVTVPATYTGTTLTTCPNGVTCRNVTVTSSNGTVSSVLTIMLVLTNS